MLQVQVGDRVAILSATRYEWVARWPWQTGWKALWDNVIAYPYPTAQPRAA